MRSWIQDLDDVRASGQYRTMADLVFMRLRDAILHGSLSPGDRIPQASIAAELNISRMPLRDALRRLEERGFVTITPHRGAFVTPISAEHLRQTYFVRTELEAASAKIAAEKMDPLRLEQLSTILDEAEQALAESDEIQLADLNRRFHLAGHEAAGLPLLSRVIADFSDHCHRYRLMHAALGERARVALAEHRTILAAWERHDGEAAAEAIRVNLANSERALLASLEQARAAGLDESGLRPSRSGTS
jgi:DNA-binding GntR family transcriptional regulator